MNEKICRLCLKTISTATNNTHFETIGETLKNILDNLLNLNLDISKESVVCYECTNNLQASSNFKRVFVCTMESEEFNSTNIILNRNTINQTECCFCMKSAGNEGLISLNESKENMFIVDMIQAHIPDWNLNSAKEYLTCHTCLESLQTLLSFIMNCLDVEEKIMRYIEIKGTNGNGQVELNDVQQFTLGSMSKYKNDYGDAIDMENADYEFEQIVSMKVEAEIKNKELDNLDLNIKPEELDGLDLNINPEELDTVLKQTIFESFQDTYREIPVVNIKTCLFQCELCLFSTKCKIDLEKHTLTHEIPLIKKYKCEMCTYETKYSVSLKWHILSHKNHSETAMYKCELCTYETKKKRYLNEHMVTHKHPSVIKMYNCEICSYETKRKESLRRHTLIHKNPSELTMYMCQICEFQTKYRVTLNRHMSSHKCTSEATMYKCEMCTYETTQKRYLNVHKLSHKNSTKATTYKCELCSYETIYKITLNRHMFTHKDPSEITMYKCDMCSYETKQKRYLNGHMLIHKDPLEVKMYKCEMCNYEAKQRRYLKRHMQIHINKCKSDLKTHCTT